MRSNAITGRVQITIAGAQRELACDMSAVEVLYGTFGDLWASWLEERFVGAMLDIGNGLKARAIRKLAREEIGLVLYAPLASDRRGRPDCETVESLLNEFDEEEVTQAQELAALCIIPMFEVPGEGFSKAKNRSRTPAPEPETARWSWRLTLATAFGLVGLRPDEFWSLTLVEWQLLLEGYEERQRQQHRQSAWIVSHLLVAAGCDASKVTVERLLGEEGDEVAPQDGEEPDLDLVFQGLVAEGDRIAKAAAEQAAVPSAPVVMKGEGT